MVQDTIVRLNHDRGFGFVRPDEGRPNVFVHAGAVVGRNIEQVQEGQRVAIEIGPDPLNSKLLRAVMVRMIEEWVRPLLAGPAAEGNTGADAQEECLDRGDEANIPAWLGRVSLLRRPLTRVAPQSCQTPRAASVHRGEHLVV